MGKLGKDPFLIQVNVGVDESIALLIPFVHLLRQLIGQLALARRCASKFSQQCSPWQEKSYQIRPKLDQRFARHTDEFFETCGIGGAEGGSGWFRILYTSQ